MSPPRASRDVGDRLVAISRRLASGVDRLAFAPPVRHVYNPLRYAAAPHDAYLERYGGLGASTLLLGMNPGPWGMVQTGVPFGEVRAVRDWLRIDSAGGRPELEHPKRPVDGLACRRSEVSGQRFWGWAERRFGTPERFFRRFLVWNYCPLAFLEESGRNRTPDHLPANEREPLFDLCDRALGRLVDLLAIESVVGIGSFAERRAREALIGRPIRVGSILHPSPASPIANRGWAERAERQLRELGIAIDLE